MINKVINRDGIDLHFSGGTERGLLKDIVALDLDPIAKRAASLAFHYIDLCLPEPGIEQLTILANANGWGVDLNAPGFKKGSSGWFNKKAESISGQGEVNIRICSQSLSPEETAFELFKQLAFAEMYWNIIPSFKPAERRFYFNKKFPKINGAMSIVADRLKSPETRSKIPRECGILGSSFRKESGREAMFDSFMANA
jgi:hypothetical protein